jgi:hypothetical protein
MDKKTLQTTILEKTYRPEKWLDVMKEYFSAKKFHLKPLPVSLPSKDIAESAVELGSFYTADERLIAIYEVKLTDKALIEKNRVGLRNLFKSVIRYDLDAALIVYVQQDKWRFSYVSEIRTAEGKRETEPKRYTYLFGEGESCRTAADRFDKLKGKPIYLNDLFDAFSVEKLNKDFFKTYKEFYEKFWKYLADTKTYYKLLYDKRQDDNIKKEKPIRDFAKKLLGRIVFLQFLQKKGWMGVPVKNNEWKGGDTKFLQSLFTKSKNQSSFHSKELRTLFFETLNERRRNDLAPASLGKGIKIPYLNGGLFEKDISFTNDIDFPGDLFAKLLDFFEQYNFTIDENDPYDSEVGIDPEMLGHIFENLLEENREKGAFYTPKEIVHYMCQESLIEYLHTQLPACNKEDIELLVRNNQVSKSFSQYKTANEINGKLITVKVCDPAIGSGAFPMGLLKEIFECRRLLYGYLKTSDKFDPAQVKKDIIQQNIYGVDLENGAVEIARLRFWLALVVDESEPQPLPNLDYKIMQGDSLLERFEGVDLSHVAINNLKIIEPQKDLFGNIKESQLKITYTKTEIVAEIQKRMKSFFNLENAELKEQYRSEINELVHEHIEFNFDLRKIQVKRWLAELESIKSKTDKQAKKIADYKKQLESLKLSYEKLKELETRNDKPFFLWKLFFADVFADEGFDIVIGNPPYIQLQRMIAEAEILRQAEYETFTKTGDIYCLFYEQGVKLLKPKGTLCYITSNSWMKTQYGELLRNYFVEKGNPLKLLNFEDTKIFHTATVEANILVLKKEGFQNLLSAVAIKPDYKIGLSLNDYFSENSFVLTTLSSEGWIILSKQDDDIKNQIEKAGTPLREFNITINFGIKTGFNEAFIIDEETKRKLINEDSNCDKIIKPVLRGRDMSKFAFSFGNKWIIISPYKKNIELIEKYPSVYKHLLFYEEKLKQRGQVTNGQHHWLELDNNPTEKYLNLFEGEKIMWGELSDKPKFSYDKGGYYAEATLFIIVGDDLKYLLSILNSRLSDWYFNKITSTSGMGTSRWKKYKIEQLPIPKIENKKTIQKFEVFADYLIYLNDESKPPVNPYTSNASIAPVFEDVLNMMVYELYFEGHLKQEEIDVLKFVDTELFPPLTKDDKDNAEFIGRVYKRLQEQENPIRNRIILSNIRSKDIIRRINSTTH